MKERALRVVYWSGFFFGPIALVLGFMDFISHSYGPGVGLEGQGPSVGPALVTMSFALAVASAVSRMAAGGVKPSIARGLLLGVIMFFATGLLSRPLFHWKWAHDCDREVGKACFALSQMALDPTRREELGAKACDLGVASACPSATASTTASTMASSAPGSSAMPSTSSPSAAHQLPGDPGPIRPQPQ